MKKINLLWIVAFTPLLMQAQDFDPGMNKIETVKYINSIIEPEGNKAALSSIGTEMNFTENFFATATRKTYKLNLKDVNFIMKSSTVVLKCKNGSCIEFELSSPENSEVNQISELSLKSTLPSNLLKALKLLKTRVGL